MKPPGRSVARPTLPQTAQTTVLAAAFYLYVWLRIDPRLQLHATDPVFYTGWEFLREFLGRPGGLLEYLSALATHAHYFPTAGALLITIVAFAVCFFTRLLILEISGRRVAVVHLVPAILLLVLESRYGNPMTTALGLLFALACALLYVRIPLRRPWIRGAAFLLLSTVLYYVAAGPFLLFALLCGMFEMSNGPRYLPGLVSLAVGALLPWFAARFLFVLDLRDAYFLWIPVLGRTQALAQLPILNKAASVGLYLYPPLAVLAVTVSGRLGGRKRRPRHSPPHTTKASISAGVPEFARTGAAGWVFQTLAILVVAAVVAAFSFDARAKRLVQIDYNAKHKNWERVLALTADLNAGYAWTIHCTNRALYHTGRLPYAMFRYPQIADSSLLYPTEKGYRTYMQMCDLFLDLGHVNYAEKWAFEALEVGGDRPATVQRLARICILKERTEAARTFLRFLSRNLLYGKWARRCLADLESDPLLSTDEELTRIRACMVGRDYSSHYLPPEPMLESLLKANPRNRMAFEYLMAHHLLCRRPDLCCRLIGRLGDLGYRRIPPLYEEAVLLCQLRTGKSVDLQGRRISPETLRRIDSFAAIMRETRADRAKAMARLENEYGDTYAFFQLTGRSAGMASERSGAGK